MIDLPTENWVRSPKMPDWALCLDPAWVHYGWKMYECNGNWVSGHRLTNEEIEQALTMESLEEHWPKFRLLLEHRAQNGKGES